MRDDLRRVLKSINEEFAREKKPQINIKLRCREFRIAGDNPHLNRLQATEGVGWKPVSSERFLEDFYNPKVQTLVHKLLESTQSLHLLLHQVDSLSQWTSKFVSTLCCCTSWFNITGDPFQKPRRVISIRQVWEEECKRNYSVNPRSGHSFFYPQTNWYNTFQFII